MNSRRRSVAEFDGPEVYRRFRVDPRVVEAGRALARARAAAVGVGWGVLRGGAALLRRRYLPLTARELDDLVASAAPTSPEDATRLRAFAEKIEAEKREAEKTARANRNAQRTDR